MQLDNKPESVNIQGSIGIGLDPKKHKWAIHEKTKNNILVAKRGLVAETAQILDELKLVQKLEHENILPFLEHFTDDQAIYLCSPLMDLGSAERLLNSFYNDGFPEPAIQKDYSPWYQSQNILLDTNGSVKLAGFENALLISGCNRWIGVEEKVHDFRESLSSVFIWLAPEIMKQDLCGYGVTSDVYSIGITLCELGNGFAPFQEMEAMQILFEKLRGSTPYILDTSSEGYVGQRVFTPALHDITAKCLSYDGNQRSSCDELLKHGIFKEQLENTKYMSLSNLLPEATPCKLTVL
uniref:Protein kinase domain-containing protein n=1 Tax=Ditylenchus dipsaci TaxID=166011 RepID=A0A915CP27_9BILA